MRVFLLFSLLFLLTACSTRQPSDVLTGSTAQRLVTYSIEKLIDELDEKSLKVIKSKKVYLQTHFVDEHPVLDYADRLLRLKLQSRYQAEWVNKRSDAELEMDFFFTSIGTDFDTFGLSIPFLDLTGGSSISRINLLSMDMFHGIAEAYFFLRNRADNSTTQSKRQLARTRSDSISTPVISFPLNQLD